jgi:hypothetical protein
VVSAGDFLEPLQIPAPESLALGDRIGLRTGFKSLFAPPGAKIELNAVTAGSRCRGFRLDLHAANRIGELLIPIDWHRHGDLLMVCGADII